MNQTLSETEAINYEPLKQNFSEYIVGSSLGRKVFYLFLNTFMLRSWYIRKELRHWGKNRKGVHYHILDAGSGFGQNTYYLSNLCKKWSILAVDIHSGQIGNCNTFFHELGRDNVIFRVRNLEALSQAETFQLIISIETLMFIEDDRLVLGNFQRALQKDGMLLLCFPACEKTISLKGERNEGPARVRNGYCKTDIQSKLKGAGFSNVRSYFTHGKYGQMSKHLSTIIPARLSSSGRIWHSLLPVYYLLILPACLLLNLLDYTRKQRNGEYLIVKAWK